MKNIMFSEKGVNQHHLKIIDLISLEFLISCSILDK